MKLKTIVLAGAISALAVSCTGADGDNPGIEYAPNMYHSVPYEPLSQIVDEHPDYNSSPYNDFDGKKLINVRQPVEGTVSRQYYNSIESGTVLFYDQFDSDDLDSAAKVLKNPVPDTEAVLADGESLYNGYCAHCHGKTGLGDGKVGKVYKGVPNYTTGRYATMSEGHIFHVITHGKGRMWPHKSLVNTEDRWKIVRYVQKLQKGE